MAWEEDSCICLNMQLIAILSRIGVNSTNVFAEKIMYFCKQNVYKTRPDSLTNQRLPGINVTKITFFLVTTK